MFCNGDTSRGSKKGKVERKDFFLLPLSFFVVLSVLGPIEAEASSSGESLEPLNRFPRMVQEYLVRSVRRIETQANERRAALMSRADAEAYVRQVREKIQQSFGPWPEKTPLKPRITGTVERDA